MDYNNLEVKKAAEVVQSFVLLTKTITKFTKENAQSLGLTVQQMGILNKIYSTPKITFKELTDSLMLPKSTTSVSVDELVNIGLIERKACKEDRRKIDLCLTVKGNELAKKSIENPASYLAMIKALENISQEEIEKLLDIHKKIYSFL